mmetsp:Transcript_45276/g.141941  ORF Transcript_45276/g.141941 Transcript_45276/m.141941 type:complete len:135 (-) Transcript_45276:1777-2181(-)
MGNPSGRAPAQDSTAIVPWRGSAGRARRPAWRPSPDNLPVHTDYEIFGFCPDAETLAVCARVCRRWRALAEEEELWQRLTLKRWGVKADGFRDPPPAKALYRCNAEHYLRLRRLYRHGQASFLGRGHGSVSAVF